MAILSKQYTLGDVMNIDSGRQERAGGCSVKLSNVYHELKDESILDRFKSLFLGRPVIKRYYLIFKFEVSSDTGHKHIVYIRVSPDFDLNKWTTNKVKIYCDCSDFKYRCAYVLGQHGSLFTTSKILSSLGAALGDAPKKTSKTSLLCKHAFAAVNYLVNNYSSIMRTV